MAKYRQIHVSYWQDGFILQLPPEEKFFYIYLMTNSKTTQCGIYELPLKVVEIETGLSSDKIFELLHKFVSYRRIQYNEETREIMLLNWLKHNSLKSPKIMSCALKELEQVKHIPFIEQFVTICKQYKYPIVNLSIPYPKGYKPSLNPYGEEQEEEQEREQKQKAGVSADSNEKIRSWLFQYNVQCRGTFELEQTQSFIGTMDIEVIEHCIKQAEGKHVTYLLTILQRFLNEGKTTKESIRPLHAVPSKQQKHDPELEARRIEIARNKWISEGNDPDAFVYPPASGA